MPTPLDGPWYLDIVALVTGAATMAGAWRVLRYWGPVGWVMKHAGNDIKISLREVIEETTGPQITRLVDDIAVTKDALDATKQSVDRAQVSVEVIHQELTYDNGTSVKDMVKDNVAALARIMDALELDRSVDGDAREGRIDRRKPDA